MLPREKFLKGGVDYLSDTDLISILVGSGIKGKNFRTISLGILKKIKKNIKEGLDTTISDLTTIDGVGSVTAMRILSGIELGRRIYGLYMGQTTVVKNSNQAYELLKSMSKFKQEHIVALYLNSRFELLEQRTVRIGGVDSAGLLPRDLYGLASVQCL